MSALFSLLTVKQVTFRNRIVMPPMVCVIRPDYGLIGDDRGRVTDSILEHYRRRAAAGAGMIIVEATAVDAGGRVWAGGLGVYDDEHLHGLTRLADTIHAEGAVASIQLVHGGPKTSPAVSGQQPVGPSAVKFSDEQPIPRVLTIEEIQQIEQRFADAAARAVTAGFDAVEVHGAHGFLLDTFLSPQRNQRIDAYGGNMENRMRMLQETCRLVRQRIGDRALLDCRINLFNQTSEPIIPDDLRTLIQGLETTGLDLLHISTDGALAGSFGESITFGQRVKGLTRLPLIVAGGINTPADAERLIAEGHADFAAVGRAMLSNPDWARHAWEALTDRAEYKWISAVPDGCVFSSGTSRTQHRCPACPLR